jgi:tetratricopeptide (TPR) repeat protein
MSIEKQALVHSILDELTAHGRDDQVIAVISAVHDLDSATDLFHNGNFDGAVRKFEEVAELLSAVPEARILYADAQQGLVSAYARTGRVKDAIRVGRAAIPILASHPYAIRSYARSLLSKLAEDPARRC